MECDAFAQGADDEAVEPKRCQFRVPDRVSLTVSPKLRGSHSIFRAHNGQSKFDRMVTTRFSVGLGCDGCQSMNKDLRHTHTHCVRAPIFGQ